MKPTFTILLLLSILFSEAGAQPPTKYYKVRYEANYKEVPKDTANATLFFNDTCSLYCSDDYYLKPDQGEITKSKQTTPEGKTMVTLDAKGPFEGELLQTVFSRSVLWFPAKYLVHMKSVACIAEEKLPLIRWEFRNGHKQFGNYQANEAYCQFRGRKYQAWYIPAIPTMAGPWKFNGLPGLIVEVKDEDNAVLFDFKSIEEVVAPWPSYKLPARAELLDMKTYSKREHEGLQELVGVLLSKSGRNQGSTSGVELQRDDRELNFDDLQ